MDYLQNYSSPYGTITMASNGLQLIGLWFKGQKYFASTLQSPYQTKDLKIFQQTIKWLDQYFAGKLAPFTPPLLLRTSDFQKAVAQILLKIPYGKTMTYGKIAKILAYQKHLSSMAAQAVGQAVGRNPIALIIPCHRVLGSAGKLTGYAAGISLKRKLLAAEHMNYRFNSRYTRTE